MRLVLAIAVLLWCGGCKEPGSPSHPAALTFTTGDFDVAPAGETFECFYTNVITDRELAVGALQTSMSATGHHLIIFYSDTIQEPRHFPCDPMSGHSAGNPMAGWHWLWVSSGHNSDGVHFSEGAAIRIPKGKQLTLQVHHLNSTNATVTAADTVEFQFVDPYSVRFYLEQFEINDEGFKIPPHARYQRSTQYTMERDLQLVLFFGHMHTFGARYQLERIDKSGGPAQSLYDQRWQPSYKWHPPLAFYNTPSTSQVLHQGDVLRQTCEWNNTTEAVLEYPQEMCVGSLLYRIPASPTDQERR